MTNQLMAHPGGGTRGGRRVIALPVGPRRFASEELKTQFARKEVALSQLRTSVAVLALPMTVSTVLLATSDPSALLSTPFVSVPVLAVCGLLAVLGIGLLGRALAQLWRVERRVAALVAEH